MKRKYKPFLRVLALIMALVCLGVSLAPASFAFAGVLDPAAWLYPIWSMYGAANGVQVTTTGDADFTIDGMTSLWNEYQTYKVNSGSQQVVQTLTDFVNGVKGFVRVVAGAVTGGSLDTKLMLGAGIVGALDAFWNWIITEKLGGTSVDSTDFDDKLYAVNGSLFATVNVIPSLWNTAAGTPVFTTYYAPNQANTTQYYLAGVTSGDNEVFACCVSYEHRVYFFRQGRSSDSVWVRCPSVGGAASSWTLASGNVYYCYYTGPTAEGYVFVPDTNDFESFQDALSAFTSTLGPGTLSGDLTAVPDLGVDVLGFPDASDQEYVPSDAVIPWNIPYDQALDTDGYIEAAFDEAVQDELEITEPGPIVEPIPQVGPVGDYIAPGLGDVFPFCIPFDIYDFLSALAADPVAPSFTAELAFPEAVGGSQYVELDFDTPTFNQLASILRTMELLAFIVGLALLTRSMFIRG